MKKITPLIIASVALGIITLPSVLKSNSNNDGGVLISNEKHERGPIFYPASYSSSYSDEPYYSTQNDLTFSKMNYVNASNYYRGDSVKVAVIDSGINYPHEDFGTINGSSRSVEYNSGWYYYEYSNNAPHLNDTLGHGTNVASVIASAINEIGCAGIAPNVDLYIYKVTNSNNGYEWTAINSALQYCIDNDIDVINMSFQAYEHAVTYNNSTMGASTGCSSVLTTMINSCYNAGITLVAAAGNYNTSEPSYPASNNHVISVGSLAKGSTTSKAGYSNTYGIDIVAPGSVYVADKGSNNAYKETQGTSFSSPIVTAAIALYKQKNPSATPSQIESALYASCDAIDGNPSWAGNGRLNIDRFLGIESGNVPTVSSVIVSPNTLSLDLNGTKTGNLSATVSGNNNPSQSVTWTSSNTSVATVSSGGVVTAKSVGSATITATSTLDVTKSGTCSVTVSDSTVHVTGVTLNKSSTTIAIDATETLTVTVAPANATNKNVSWSSSDSTVATVSSSGVVTAKKEGSATITVTTEDGGKTATCLVTVNDSPKESLTITRSSFATSGGYAWYDWSQNTSSGISISGKGELYTTTTTSMQFNKSKGSSQAAIFNTVAIPGTISKIEARTDSGTNRSWSAYVTSTACSLSGSTLVFGSNKTTVGSGVTIATSLTSLGTFSSGYSYFCLQENDSSASLLAEIKVTYIPKSVSSIYIKTAPTKTSYEVGETFDPTGLVVTVNYSDSTSQDVSYLSNPTSFTFNPSTSTSLSKLNTSVTITYGGKSASQSITVSDPVSLSSISISGQATSFVEGDAFVFGGTVTAHFSDSSSNNVTSSSTFTGYDMTVVGEHTVTVSYTYKGTTKSSSYGINVSQGTLSSISVSGQTTTYVKNSAFSFDGVCTATFANGYQNNVTPTSVSSPDMSSGGVKTVTVSYSYNGVTKDTTYQISVNAYRTVMDSVYSVVGTITYPSNTQTISVSTLSVSTSGYTTTESNSIRLGSGSNTGTVTVTSTTSNIYKIVVSAKTYGSDTGVTLTIGGMNNTLTSSYADYSKEYVTATNSVAIATTTSKKRAHIQTITVYTKSSQDVGQSDDCVGLETFINTYMHMDYTTSLGYCKDNDHHYYSTAKGAFNALNTNQRRLFTTNSAYSNEWSRLSTWASFNGESLNSNNVLTRIENNSAFSINYASENNITLIIVLLACTSLALISAYSIYRKKQK